MFAVSSCSDNSEQNSMTEESEISLSTTDRSNNQTSGSDRNVESSASSYEGETPSSDDEIESPEGVYTYANRDVKMELYIHSTTWSATSTLVSGFGEDYDDSQSESFAGVIRDNILYDDTGYIAVGKIWRNARQQWAVDFDHGLGRMVLFKE
jgi:hypothetical protein